MLKTRNMAVPLWPRRPCQDKHLVVLAAIVWAGVVGAGSLAMLLYQASPGDPGVAVTRWPAQSSLPRVEGRPSLVMFLHPKCSCSRASIAELQRLMTRLRGRVQPVVVMIQILASLGETEPGDLRRQSAVFGCGLFASAAGAQQ